MKVRIRSGFRTVISSGRRDRQIPISLHVYIHCFFFHFHLILSGTRVRDIIALTIPRFPAALCVHLRTSHSPT